MVAQAAAQTATPASGARAAPARDRGLLWQLQRDGRTSYLYGTVHVGRASWAVPGPRVAAALDASQTLALELDLDDPALAQQLVDVMREASAVPPTALRPPDHTPGRHPDRAQAAAPALEPALESAPGSAPKAAPELPARLDPGPAVPPPVWPAALLQRLARATARACLPPQSAADVPPLLQVSALTVLDARWAGLDPAYGQDRVLAARARQRGLRVTGLETLRQQAAALQPAGALSAQAQLEQALQQLESGQARRVTARLVQVWASGDLMALSNYETWCACAPTAADRQLLLRLNDERNPHLADGITALHARGESVFAAVGALHMTGPAALPALLAARGFRVERLRLAP